MFILQDGKLHIQEEDKLVGVDVYSDKVVLVKGSETKFGKEFSLLTPFEVRCKFNIELEPYKFPKVEKKEVVVSATTTIKKAGGKSK